MRRSVIAVVAGLAVALAGCSFSKVDPDATVRISGRALDAAGRPLADTRVLLFKQADLGEVVFGSVFVIGTLSAVCFLPDPPAICRRAVEATTDSRGRYRFTVKGADTQGSLGTESTLNVVFADPDGAGSSTISFTAKKAEVALPAVRIWDAQAKLVQRRAIRLSWKPLRGSGPTTYSAQFVDDAGAGLWTQPLRSGGLVDPRVLEDRSGAVAINAGTEISGGQGAGMVRVASLSRRLPFRGTAGAPPSRGRPCAAVVGATPKAVRPTRPCPETDGDFDTPARLSGKGVVTGTVLDLGRVRPVGLVVARGFSGQVVAEVSVDGRRFVSVGTFTVTGDAGAQRTGDVRARYVRLRAPAGLDQSLSTELSVW